MNRAWKYIFFGLSLFWISINASVSNDEDQRFKMIIADVGDNITLPCHPSLGNLTKHIVLGNSDFEWISDNGVPMYTNGRLSPFLSFLTLEKHFEMENSSLILRNIQYGYTTLTCRVTRFNLTYTYYVHVNIPTHHEEQTEFILPIRNAKEGEQLVLPCLSGNAMSSLSYSWLLLNLYENGVEIISINRTIVLEDNEPEFRIADDGSLVIPHFTPSYKMDYQCSSSNGVFVRYYVPLTSGSDKKDNSTSLTIQKEIAVESGNTVSMRCPVDNSNFVWMRNNEELLFINGHPVMSSRIDNLRISSDERSLIIANFSSSLSGTYTCFSDKQFTYIHIVEERKNPINRTIVAYPVEKIVLPCPRSDAENGSYFVWILNDVEYLYINEHDVTNRNSDKLKISQDDGRSLIIKKFSFDFQGKYECRLSSGMNYTYHVKMADEDLSLVKKKDLIVDFATRGLVLPCPKSANNNDENTWYEWDFSRGFRATYMLYLNGEKFAAPYNNYYEIKNTSLVILLLDKFQFGIYTCRWSTGEKYIYNITHETHAKNHEILANQGENVTFPCPLEDPRDRELDLINWMILLTETGYQYYGIFNFVAGKLLSTEAYNRPIPDDIILSDDKQSLTVSNVTLGLQGDYYCYLMASSTKYKYSLKVKRT